jgi:hypothetical protein
VVVVVVDLGVLLVIKVLAVLLVVVAGVAGWVAGAAISLSSSHSLSSSL